MSRQAYTIVIINQLLTQSTARQRSNPHSFLSFTVNIAFNVLSCFDVLPIYMTYWIIQKKNAKVLRICFQCGFSINPNIEWLIWQSSFYYVFIYKVCSGHNMTNMNANFNKWVTMGLWSFTCIVKAIIHKLTHLILIARDINGTLDANLNALNHLSVQHD